MRGSLLYNLHMGSNARAEMQDIIHRNSRNGVRILYAGHNINDREIKQSKPHRVANLIVLGA